MTHHPIHRAAAALAAAALLAACSSGSDDTTSPTTTTPVNVAQLYGELTVPGVSSALTLFPTTLPTVTTSLIGSCPYDAASKSFVCAPTTSNGITYAVSYQLLDAAGNALGATADRSTAAAMRTVTTASGTVTSTAAQGGFPGTLQLSQRSDMTLSGLLGATHTLNGTSTTTSTATVDLGSGAVSVATNATEAVKDLVVPATTSSATPVYPTSGTITVDATTSLGAGTPALATHAVLTFDGTSAAALTLTSGGATRRCTVSLAGLAAPVCAAAS